jgi:sodium transport system permease protein
MSDHTPWTAPGVPPIGPTSSDNRQSARIWDGGHALLFFVLAALSSLLLGVILLGPLGFYGSVALTEIAAFALIPFLLSRWFDTGWSGWLSRPHASPSFWMWAVVAVFAFALVESNLPVLLDRIYPIPPSQLEFYQRYLVAGSPAQLLGFLIVAAIIPAVCEEIAFRGMIQNGLRRSFGASSAIIGSGFLFALLHLNPWNFIGLWTFGCLLAYLTERSGSIRPAIVVHALNNSLALLVYAAQGQEPWERPLELLPWYVTVPAAAVLIVSIRRLHHSAAHGRRRDGPATISEC